MIVGIPPKPPMINKENNNIQLKLLIKYGLVLTFQKDFKVLKVH